MKKLALTFGLLFTLGCFAFISAQSSPIGIWKTIDDETGEAKSHVEIYKQGNKYYGKIVKILTENKDALCDKCEGKKKNQPILGLVIVENLEAYDDYWKGGTILDPQSGGSYKLSVWFEKGETEEIKIRGKHWTGLFRTQTWYKVK